MFERFTKGVVLSVTYHDDGVSVVVARKVGGAACPRCKRLSDIEYVAESTSSEGVKYHQIFFKCTRCNEDNRFVSPGQRATLVLEPNNYAIKPGHVLTWGTAFAWWFPPKSIKHAAEIRKFGFAYETSGV